MISRHVMWLEQVYFGSGFPRSKQQGSPVDGKSISTCDPEGVAVPSDTAIACAARIGPLGEVRLLSRNEKSAVVVHVPGDARSREKRLDLAKQLAGPALHRLEAALAETMTLKVR
jgi:hypothetical protein